MLQANVAKIGYANPCHATLHIPTMAIHWKIPKTSPTPGVTKRVKLLDRMMLLPTAVSSNISLKRSLWVGSVSLTVSEEARAASRSSRVRVTAAYTRAMILMMKNEMKIAIGSQRRTLKMETLLSLAVEANEFS
jgi:hypothetical protein